jgi:hypothetical protein
MPSSHLKRAERAIAAIRDRGEVPPEIVEALEEHKRDVNRIQPKMGRRSRR